MNDEDEDLNTTEGAADTGADTGAAAAGETNDAGSTEPTSGLEALNAALDGDDDGNAAGTGEEGKTEGGDGAGEKAPPDGEVEDGEAAGETRQTKADAAAGGDTKAQAADPVNDPLPESLKGKTRERMEQLVKIAKEGDERYREVLAQRDEILESIRSTGASPEQFTRMLDTLKSLNAATPEEKRKGLAMLREDVQRIATLLGEDVGDPQLLDRHADLKAAVEEGEITAKYAREVALAREQRARQDAALRERRELTESEQRAIKAGTDALNALEQELKADPDYERKKAVLVPKLKAEFARLPPSQWATKFAAEYAKLKLPAAAAANGAAAQPMRARQPAGAARRQPKTGLEAVNMALDDLAGRASE